MRTLAFAACVIFVSGCRSESLPDRFERVRIGMVRSEVEPIMGTDYEATAFRNLGFAMEQVKVTGDRVDRVAAANGANPWNEGVVHWTDRKTGKIYGVTITRGLVSSKRSGDPAIPPPPKIETK